MKRNLQFSDGGRVVPAGTRRVAHSEQSRPVLLIQDFDTSAIRPVCVSIPSPFLCFLLVFDALLM